MSRWLQAPLYIGLIVAQGVYVWQFWLELVHLIGMMADKTMTETALMLIVLGLIDVVMISNLLVMVMSADGRPSCRAWISKITPINPSGYRM